jgi:D-glycero-alpha-D-manno-heptose-7-phosphate kinase
MIITKAPIRISLLGGGSDYPAWYLKNGGLVVGGAINKYSYLAVRQLPPYFPHQYRLMYRKTEEVKTLDEIEHQAIKACIDYAAGKNLSVELSHMSDLPARSGTGSSSTFVVGLLLALFSLGGKYTPPAELAKHATNIERAWLNETVGSQDQVFAAHGGFNEIRFHRNGDISVFPVALSSADFIRP